MNAEDFHAIAVGDIISYTPSLHQYPSCTPRAYLGVVNRIHAEAQTVSVRLLDEELEALNEPVRLDHIRSVVKSCGQPHRQQGQIKGGPHA